jgi:hypothetical protein
MAAYGATAAQVRDSIADGRFTFYALTDAGKWAPSLSGNITIYKQDTRKVQAMFKPDASNFLPFKWGTDGNRTWSSDAMGYQIPAGGPALWWTEVHTVRSVQRLLNYVQQQLVLHDMGINGTSHVVEAQDPEGRTTTYYIDIATARVIRLDFISGEARQMFSGAWLPTYETYIFSDFHTVDGVLTPFRITRNPDWDIQEVQLNNTIYNPGVPNSIFQPY